MRYGLAFLVRVTGIETARRKALDPKSSASASSATLAFLSFQNEAWIKATACVRDILY